MPKLGNHQDCAQYELRNAVIQNLSGHSSTPKAGQIDFLTSGNIPYCFNGSAWRPLDAAALTDGSILNSALQTNPLARANHTGTQLANTISNLAATVQGYTLDQFATPAADVSWGNHKLTSLADPVNAQDAATKNWVTTQIQSAAAGISSKAPVKAVSTANISSLSGTMTVDGVSLSAGDRVLLTAQTTASQNGVWVVASGAWSRASDENGQDELDPGALWLVLQGSVNAGTQWRLSTTGTITVGTTSVTIVQFSAASPYSAGNGTSLTGTTFAVQLDSGTAGLIVTASGLKIDTTVVTRKYSATITGDGSTTAFSLNPALGTTDLIVFVKDSSGNMILVDTQVVSSSNVTVTFGTAPANTVTYRATVLG